MDVLVVHEVNYFRKPVYEFIEIPEALSIRGHDVTVVDYGEGEQGFLHMKKEFRGNRLFKDAHVKVVRPGHVKIGELFARFTAMFSNYFTFRKLFRDNKFDAVILYSVPTNGWQTVLLANRYKVPVLFRAIDVLYDLRPHPSLIKRFIRYMEKFVYERSQHVLSLTPRMWRYTGIKSNLPLYSAVNKDIFHPMSEQSNKAFMKEKGLSDARYITYIGYFYEFSGLDIFIEKLKDIQKKVPDAKLLLVGGGEADARLRKLAEGNPDVIFTGFVPYEDVSKYINISSACLVPFRECAATRDIVPIKLFQYLACRKPVVSRDLKGIREIVPDDSGVLFAGSDDALVETTCSLLVDKDAKELARKGYEHCMKHHSFEAFIDTLEKHLKTAAASKPDSIS